jgi:hypothetical protein
MVNVVCVFSGTKFSKDYVYNLKNAVERNTTVPHRFICLSDLNTELPGIDTMQLKPGYSGWWNKIQLFDGRLKGQVVYLDLDTLITGNIDWLLNHRGFFAGIEDLGAINSHQPWLKGRLQSGILSFNADQFGWVWTDFILSISSVMKTHRGDGEYLNSLITKRELLQNIYPDAIKSYKYQVYPDNIGNASIVCFHGRPSIIQSMSETITTPKAVYEPQLWVKEYWK